MKRWPFLFYLSVMVIAAAISLLLYGFYHVESISSLTNHNKKSSVTDAALKATLHTYAKQAKLFCKANNLNTSFCFLIDMDLPSGRKRFFIYNLSADSVAGKGMVAHGSCNTAFLAKARFSNEKGCGCTAAGKYKTGYKYAGSFGTAYKLTGFDKTNNNAYERSIVLHSYSRVPDNETAPLPICNSLGCPMVSPSFLKQLSVITDKSSKPVLLWIFAENL